MSWYPEEMRRADIIVTESKKEGVVRALKESGTIELIDAKESGLEKAPLSGTYPRISELAGAIEEALDSFGIVQEKKGLIEKVRDVTSQKPPKKVKVREEGAKKLIAEAEKKLPVVGKIRSVKDALKGTASRRARLLETEGIASVLEALGTDPKSMTGHDYVFVSLGKVAQKDIPAIRSGISKLTKSCWMKTAGEGEDAFMVISAPKELEERISKILSLNGFDPLKVPEEVMQEDIPSLKRRLKKELDETEKEERELKAKLKGIEDDSKKDLLVTLEQLLIEKKLAESEMMFARTEKTYLISCWVRSDMLEELDKTVKEASENAYSIASRKPEKGENPPSILENKGPAGGIEIITQNYGTPSYGELDPTKFITLTFPFLFGMMFGDIGHGIMLLIAGFALSRLIPGASARKLGITLILCGIAATVFGVLYGSAFGLTHENTPQMFEPLWMEPLAGEGKNITSFIRFSIVLAIVVLSLGCFLNIINKGRHSLMHAFFHPWGVLGLWVLWAGAYLFFSHGIGFITLIISGLMGDMAALSTVLPGLVMLVIPVALVPVGGIFVEKRPAIIGLYDAFEVLQTFLVNVISYVRVVIIAVVHGALLLMVLKIMELVTSFASGPVGTVLSLVVFIIGNLAVFGMEAMIAFVQTIRLHYYEMFSKFFSASGKKFSPFKAERNYTIVEGGKGK